MHRPYIVAASLGIQEPWFIEYISSSAFAMLLMADMPISKAAKLMRCDPKTLTSILRYWVNDAVSRMDLSGVTSMVVDETSFKRGHDYVTLVVDAIRRAVIDVEDGKGKSAITEFVVALVSRGEAVERVRYVTCDMSKSFLSAIKETFDNAVIVMDKFHVKNILMKAMDEVRKEEQRESADKRTLFCGRRLFMIPRARMTDEWRAMLESMSKMYPKTGRAYRIVAAFDELYECRDEDEAGACLKSLCSWMRRCRLAPMKEAAMTLMRHAENILTYFKDRLTNAICEGINSLVQAAKRKARGYSTKEGFKAMIYLIAGKLELSVPSPFRGGVSTIVGVEPNLK